MRKLMWVFFGVGTVLLAHGIGASLDADSDKAEARWSEADVDAAWQRGREQGRAELVPTVRGAWQAGLDEASARCAANTAVQP